MERLQGRRPASFCTLPRHLAMLRAERHPGPQSLPRQTAFSLVPSTARSLFGGTKRECGVGTVGSEIYHLITGCGYFWLAERPFLATRIPALRLDIGCRTLQERYFPAMESTQRYGRRGVSNPPSCTSPQRLLRRRRARYSVYFGETFLNRTAFVA